MKDKKKQKTTNKQTIQICSPNKSIFNQSVVPSKILITLQEASLLSPAGNS